MSYEKYGRQASNAVDDEDYWNKSQTKAFSFDDDDAETTMFGLSQSGVAKLSQQAREGVNWSATEETVPLQVSYQKPDLERLMQLALPSKTIAEALDESKPPTDIPKLKDELQSTRRQLKVARQERFVAFSPSETVLRIMLGQPYSLEGCRSYQEKTALLDYAVSFGDGNAILAVILFLSQTLKKSLFNQLLLAQPVAANHYISHLVTRYELNEAADLLGMLGRSKEVLILRYKRAIQSGNPDSVISQLSKCCQLASQGDVDGSLIRSHLTLLEHQVPVAKANMKREPPIDPNLPPYQSLVGLSLLSTLFYSCVYHWHESDTHLLAPSSLRSGYHLTDLQYVSVALRARARLLSWDDVDGLFVKKNWLGGKTMKAIIPFEKVLVELAHNDAPLTVLERYLRLVDNIEKRLALAKRYKCHRVVIDILASQGNRMALIEFQNTLQSTSTDRLYAEDALRSSSNRWKN